MIKRIKLIAATIVAGAASAVIAFAQTLTPVTVPTSTAQNALAFVGSQIQDPGTLLVVLLAVGVPLTFYVIHRLIGLIPGRKGKS
jgi:hypothetical protein